MFQVSLSNQREGEGNVLESGPNDSLKRGLACFSFQKAFEFALASSSLGWAVSLEERPCAVWCDCDSLHPFNRAHGVGGAASRVLL